MKRLLITLAVCGAVSPIAAAHEVRPAYLELRETAPETYDILWKVPARGGEERLGIYVRLPHDTEQLDEPRGISVGGAYIERWRARRSGGLAGQSIVIDGLAATGTDVLARLERLDGSTQIARLTPSAPSFVIQTMPGKMQVAGAYLNLGVRHIWGGIDHLVFVFALMLIVRNLRVLLWTITSFTLAHSITLALAALGIVHLPGPPVEATIALSILLLACEIARRERGEASLTARWPWVVAFSFGLLHGFGFAGALSQLGLPEGDVPLALFAFNVGVELGQLAFIAAVLFVLAVARRVRVLAALERQALPAAAYAIGILAAFWFFERLAGFGS